MYIIKYIVVLSVVFFLSLAAYSDTATYVGNAKCRMCHSSAYRTYSAVLLDTAMFPVKIDTSIERPQHQNIRATLTCESCHGPASLHTTLPASNRDTTIRRNTINQIDTLCKRCHFIH